MSNYIYEEKLLVPGLNACHVLPSGRILCRHPNNEGSVLVFDQYGTQTKLYIPDAKYRKLPYKALSSDSGYTTQLHTPIFKLGEYSYLFDSSKPYNLPFTDDEFLTDNQLQTKLDSMLNNGTFADDFTAQDGTDAILLNLDAASPAALAAKDAEIGELKAEKYTDNKVDGLNLALTNKINAVAADLATLSLNNERRISGLEGQVSCLAQATNAAIAGINNTLGSITKQVVMGDAVCPEAMPRYNSWTAPTTTTPTM